MPPDSFHPAGPNAPSHPGPWIMAMEWRNLLFAHWPVSPHLLAPLLPPGLKLDLWDQKAWLGVVPFHMTGIRPRGIPALPSLSAFPELNLRTYVSAQGRPGVWFFSLDAASRLAVRAARALFHLPYFDAHIDCSLDGESCDYQSVRTHRRAPPARLHVRYRPVGPEFLAAPDSLDHWLTERYCLYAADRRGQLYRGDIAHVPWPLQPAEAEWPHLDLTRLVEFPLTTPPSTLHYARYLDVRVWPLQRL